MWQAGAWIAHCSGNLAAEMTGPEHQSPACRAIVRPMFPEAWGWLRGRGWRKIWKAGVSLLQMAGAPTPVPDAPTQPAAAALAFGVRC